VRPRCALAPHVRVGFLFVKYEPLNAAFRANPYPTYAWLREHDPIHFSEGEWGIRVLSRYQDIAKVLRAPDVSRNIDESATDFSPDEEVFRKERRARNVTQSMLQLDAPDHTRLRGLVSKAFTPRAVERLRPRVQQLVDDALMVAEETGRIELIDALAFPVPFAVISDLLDMPTERSDELRDWAHAITLSLEASATPHDLAAANAAVEQVIGFLIPVIEDRRQNPGDDVLSALIAVEEDGERLSLPELISTVVLLYIAGHETTVNLIGNSALALAQNPDQRALWRDRGPSLDSNAVDELLRYDGPIQQTIRVPLVDLEVSGGILPAGHRVLTLLGSANRDGDVFFDPDVLRLDRDGAGRQLAFAQGVHYCLGAALARLEGQVALGTMIRRYEHWDIVSEPHWRDRLTIRGVDRFELALW
jgi:cytochrome P450